MTAPAMSVDQHATYMRGWLGDMHAAWCSNLGSCRGVCRATRSIATPDGRKVTVSVVLPADADLPLVTVADLTGVDAATARQVMGIVLTLTDPAGIPHPNTRACR